jgi:predicted nucleic acid-binding protein
MIVLDASTVIAFLDAHDAHHERAAALMTEHVTDGFWMHELTVAEVLVGAVREGRGNQLLDDLHAVGIRAHGASPEEPLILAELRARTGLKLPDCCVLAVALHEGATLATFDGHLRRAARDLHVQTLPEAATPAE